MNLTIARIYRRVLPTVCLLGTLVWGNVSCAEESTAVPSLVAIQAPVVELAEYMTQLQVYTHKLSLSVSAKNVPLAKFYLHESVAHLKQIQEVFPEYENQPIALLIDRLAIESYQPLNALLNTSGAATEVREFDHALEMIVNACNACHISSEAPIRIKRNDINPYMQDFNP
ncbi:hypothetical protein ACWPKS_18025 [Coraliomargarita sp. W4R72]